MKEPGYPEGDLLDINDAADYISVSTKSVRRYLQSGKLRGRKVRNVWFLPRAELDKFIEREREAAAPAPAPVATVVTVPAAPSIDPAVIDDIKNVISGFSERLSEIDQKLYLISQDRENQHVRPDLIEKEQEIEFLKTDNLKLIEELQRIKQEVTDLKQSNPKETLLLKNKMDEIESLKATISSNERGLTLLRREVEQRDIMLKQKETLVADLKDQIKRLEEQLAKRATPKPGLWGGRRGSGGFSLDVAGLEE